MKIGILGAGRIGSALALMLQQISSPILSITLADQEEQDQVIKVDVNDKDNLFKFIDEHDAIVSALPFRLNKLVAANCTDLEKSYFDFTEDADTTAYIQRIAEGHPGVFVPQCGLAPGIINIVAAALIEAFNGTVRSVEMRVGALPFSTTNKMKYYLSWSAAGLINQYIQPCDALYRGHPIKTMPLDGLEPVIIDGVEYEAFNTSGGAATMCETYAGKVLDLNYKTMRYPGHRDHMRFVLKDLNLEITPDLLEQIMNKNVAVTENDIVILYVNVTGEIDGKLRQKTYIKKISPICIKEPLSAIQSSTAGSMAAIIELWLKGKLKSGFIKQESISFEDFLGTRWGRAIYG